MGYNADRRGSTPWTPPDFEVFKAEYLKGATDSKLANRFNVSVDKVKKFLSRAFKQDTLPKRGAFTPTKAAVEEIHPHAEKLLKHVAKTGKTKGASAPTIHDLANLLETSPKQDRRVDRPSPGKQLSS